MPDDLDDRDGLTWSEQRAGRLRRLAAGEPVNDRVDCKNIAEEIETAGRSELSACTSLFEQPIPTSSSSKPGPAPPLPIMGRRRSRHASAGPGPLPSTCPFPREELLHDRAEPSPLPPKLAPAR